MPLLSDPEHKMMEEYGAWGQKKMYGKIVEGALRGTVVIGTGGVIERIYRNVKAKGHARKVLDDMGKNVD